MPSPTTDSAPHDDVSTRTQIVDAMIRVLHELPLHEVTPERVATEADTTTATLDVSFPSWDGLLLATIDRWNDRRTTPLMPIATEMGTMRFLRAIVTANIADPSLMRFLTSTLNIAAAPRHPLAPMLHARWRRFHGFVQQSLVQDIAAGREPRTMEPSRGAEQLLATYEGLQLQSMVRPEMDLLESFDRAVTRLREGWSREYVPPVWDLGRAS
ncbi:TetR/AcrR family transcriptional regulator [Curtobacterium herbarum]|nr:TetR family transcriptional regulator C-terminal domain-containing protein [Curtobacterium herbarum]MBM7474184.1 AcrR family transcriptional regulator [Curtobacterium herbarum]MCS6546007.1 TetR family transcriptional regulator C-terminal domain-containing protein [Curtobacterium herbarum]